jgi:hypothetical protein
MLESTLISEVQPSSSASLHDLKENPEQLEIAGPLDALVLLSCRLCPLIGKKESEESGDDGSHVLASLCSSKSKENPNLVNSPNSCWLFTRAASTTSSVGAACTSDTLGKVSTQSL